MSICLSSLRNQVFQNLSKCNFYSTLPINDVVSRYRPTKHKGYRYYILKRTNIVTNLTMITMPFQSEVIFAREEVKLDSRFSSLDHKFDLIISIKSVMNTVWSALVRYNINRYFKIDLLPSVFYFWNISRNCSSDPGSGLIETLTTSAKHKANSLASIHVFFNKEQSRSIAFRSIGIYYRWQTIEYAAKTN
jgi:hypothetical protein